MTHLLSHFVDSIPMVGVTMPGQRLPQRLRKITDGRSSRISRVRTVSAALACGITAVTFAAGVLTHAESASPTPVSHGAATLYSTHVQATSAVRQVVAIAPATPSEYVGARVSFNVEGAYLADFLRLFGPECGYNVDIDPTVTGILNFSAVDIPCDEAMDRIIVKTGLSARVDGNVLQLLATGTPGITLPKPEARAERPLGGIIGTIRDPAGDVLPGAVVQLVSLNSASHFIFQMQTDQRGAFAIDILPPGKYDVSVTQGAFQTYEAPVTISAGHASIVAAGLRLAIVVRRDSIAAQQIVKATASTANTAALPVCSATNFVVRVPGDVMSQASQTIGAFSIPRATYAPRPPYTESAVAARIQGAVIVRALIGKDGTARPECLNANSEISDTGLVQSALETLNSWRFNPAMANGLPIEMEQEIEVQFRLDN